MKAVFRKELADHFSSARFLILFALIAMVGVVTALLAGRSLTAELAGATRPDFVFLLLFSSTGQFFSLAQFIAFFGPLIGLVMGFDAINRERNQGTLAKLLAQPIHRDAVINAKFLAGLTTVSIMLTAITLLVSGLGLITLGVTPGLEEEARLAVYLVVSIVYIAFWLGLSILMSILFRSVATSALAAMAIWIFFAFFIGLGADMAARTIAPVDDPNNAEQLIANAETARAVNLISPVTLYDQATATVLDPFRRTTSRLMLLGRMERASMSRFKNPLPLGQSLAVVWPYLASLLALTALCFAASYLVFLRQEIRSV